MANYGPEAKDLAKLGGALVINTGSVTPSIISNHLQALKAYNEHGGPVLLDPVGAGATKIRRKAVKDLLSNGYFSVIKGNENEIKTVLGESTVQQKGVDSGKSTTSGTEKAQMVKKLAAREKNVVVMTGQIDYLSDGTRTYAIRNGDAYLGVITGSGCTLGTTIAAFLAVHKEDKLLATLAGMLLFEIASERAATRLEVRGPGTFVPAFIDELHIVCKYFSMENPTWLRAAKVEEVEL